MITVDLANNQKFSSYMGGVYRLGFFANFSFELKQRKTKESDK